VISLRRFLRNNPLLKREKLLRLFEGCTANGVRFRAGYSRRVGDWNSLKESGAVEVRTAGFRETYLVFTDDQVISRELYIHGEFDLRKLQRAHKFIKRLKKQVGPLLVDVGANLGSICIPSISRGYFRKAIAIEASSRTAEALRKNIALNKLGSRIKTLEVVAGRANHGRVRMVQEQLNLGASRVVKNGEAGIELRVKCLDELLLNTDQIGLLFLDVEGYEGDVLMGASNILKSQVPVALEFSPRLVAEHMSKLEFCSLFSGYSGFYSLNDPLGRFFDIGQISLVWDWYESECELEQTDLLFV